MPSETHEMTDTERLDWLERTRRGVVPGTMDDERGEPTRRLWACDGTTPDCIMPTLRETIDRAREKYGDDEYELVDEYDADPSIAPASPTATCGLCGEPMPPGEEMFMYHGYSGPCPVSLARDPHTGGTDV